MSMIHFQKTSSILAVLDTCFHLEIFYFLFFASIHLFLFSTFSIILFFIFHFLSMMRFLNSHYFGFALAFPMFFDRSTLHFHLFFMLFCYFIRQIHHRHIYPLFFFPHRPSFKPEENIFETTPFATFLHF